MLRLLWALLTVSTFSVQAFAQTYESEGMKYKIETLMQAKDASSGKPSSGQAGVIWAFDFLPDSRIVFADRSGKIGIFDPKTKNTSWVSGVPQVKEQGQGGLLDLRLHPDFAKNKWVYLSYSKVVAGDKMTTAVGRGKLNGNALTEYKEIFVAEKPTSNKIQFGSRIVFSLPHIFVSIGDFDERHSAQDLKVHSGKIIRLNEDGSVPKDNPFVGRKDARPEIWSLGHRSPEGLTMRPGTNELWEAEMGPRGGDEINLIKPGLNYGWPDITYGREYFGPKIGETHKVGMEQPIVYWVPSISPCNLTFYTGDVFAKWKGNLFVAALSGTQIRRLVLDGTKIVKQEEMIKDLNQRIRDIRTGPDGDLYYSTDDGKIARIVPAMPATASAN